MLSFLLHFWLTQIVTTIPYLITEVIGRTDEVEDREEILAVIETSPTTYDLLVLDYRTDISYEDDIADIESIDSCREHLRTREDSRDSFIIVLKSLEIGSTDISLIGGDTDAVVRIFDYLVFINAVSHAECV